jgi:AcrR family transcriptional regulator
MNVHSLNTRGIKMPARRRLTPEQRETQILEAALAVFSRRGYDKATVPDIAREAGIAVGTIYNYFPSKREVLVAITEKYIIAPFKEVANNPPKTGEFGFIFSLIEERLNFGMEGVEKFIPLFVEILHDPELRRDYADKVIRPVMNMMEKLVESRIKAGAFRDVDPSVITRAIGGMVIGFMLLYRMEGEKSPVHKIDRKELANELASLVFTGLIKKQTGE